MYRNIIFIFLFSLLFSCQKDSRNDDLQKKEIEIKEITDTKPILKEPVSINNSIETFLDIGTLYPEKVAVMKSDSNLDHDAAIEQFIVLIDQLNLVTIVVADFNKITREYFVAWEYKLPIIYNSDFNLKEEDVLGINHNLELVISGTTITNNNSLFIFQKTAPPKGIYIYYKNIFSHESTGTVDLVTKSRSLDYAEKKNERDKAYDISIENSNFINENTVAIIKENWVWDRRNNKYIRESSVTNTEKINVKEKLRDVYTGGKYDFLNFLNGEWYINDNTNNSKIVIINSEKSKIYIRYKDGVEDYDIGSFWHSFQKLTLYVKDSEIPRIQYKLSFILDNTDTLKISSGSTISFWDGTYNRINSSIKNKLISNTNTEISQNIPFTGIYKNVAYSLNFNYPEYTKIDSVDGVIEEGLFSLFEIDNNNLVLQLKAKTDLRSKYKISNYKLVYTEQKLESQAIRTISLHKGTLTAYGIDVEPDESPVKFEQTEVLSNE